MESFFETTQRTILEYLAETYMETCHITRQNSTVTRQTHADWKCMLSYHRTQMLAPQQDACKVQYLLLYHIDTPGRGSEVKHFFKKVLKHFHFKNIE